MKKLLPIFFMLLLLAPIASAATIDCPQRINATVRDVICTLNASQKEKLAVYVSSVNGVELKPGETLLYVEYDGRERVAWWNEKPLWFKPPARIKLPLWYALSRITDDYEGPFSSGLNWMFLGKKNIFTFTMLHENGSSEKVAVEIFIDGRSRLGAIIRGYLENVSLLAMVFLVIIGGIGVALYVLGRRGIELKLFVIASAVSIAVFFVVMSYDIISGLLFYFLGSAGHFKGDMAVGWGISAILAMVIFHLSGVHSYSIGYVAHKKSLHELKRLKLTFCSGLVWFPWILTMYPQKAVSVDTWIWLMAIAVFVVSSLSDWIIKALRVEGIFVLNVLLALAVGYLFEPDTGVLIVLLLFLGLLYLTHRRCVGKFRAEKDRWIEEIERKVSRVNP
ncbi:hypothetical protein [Thermococcus sp.]